MLEYHKVYYSYVCRREVHSMDRMAKDKIHKVIRQLQREKGITYSCRIPFAINIGTNG